MSSNSEWPESITPPIPPPVERDFPMENPPWSGWDVLVIALLMYVLPLLTFPVVAVMAQKTLYRALSIETVLKNPILALSTECAWYIVSAIYMVTLITGKLQQPFWPAIRWIWPRRYWPAFAALGIALVSLERLEHFFPVPQHLPMEEFFKSPLSTALTSTLAVTLGPFMEELFFRGFLYPTLARSLGVLSAVIITAAPFALIHGLQLGFAWGPLLIIFLVGFGFTVVRAKTGSVAASFIVHVAYNSTLLVIGLITSRHGLK